MDTLEWYKQKSDARAKRILELETELAALQLALESQSKALADARGFIRSIFPLEHPSDIRYANQYIQGMIEKWNAETVADTTLAEDNADEA